MSNKLAWNYNSGKIERKFTTEWSNSGFINMNKLPDIVQSLVEQRKSMIEYIEALHDKIDDSTQVSIQFAIDVLERCYINDITPFSVISTNVKDRIEELKQQLKP